MNCEEARQLLDPYHDGELDLERSLAVERHLETCASCTLALKRLRALQEVIAPAYFHAPADLRASLRPKRKIIPLTTSARPAPWLLRGLALAAALVVGFFLAQNFSGRSPSQTLLAEITDSHIRSLAGTHLTDVASSNQHTVRPWFEGKIDFAPPVEDLSSKGFPLVGGRLEYISGRAVAALVYERRKHFINLFVWPGNGVEPIRASQSQRGYNVVHWRNSGMTYWAISEIGAEELRQFADAVSNAVTASR